MRNPRMGRPIRAPNIDKTTIITIWPTPLDIFYTINTIMLTISSDAARLRNVMNRMKYL